MAFVTTTIRDWTKLFADTNLARLTTEQLAHSADYFEATVVAYVLMPSHLHALLGCHKIEDLSSLMNNFKSLSTRGISDCLSRDLAEEFRKGDGYSIWKPRFDDFIVSSEKQFRIKIDYIHNNPVKAGIVARAEDYQFSSANDWLCDEPGMIKVDKEWSWV